MAPGGPFQPLTIPDLLEAKNSTGSGLSRFLLTASPCLLQSSGLSTWIGHQMLSLSSLPPWAVTLLACILVSIVTEFVSNPATITIFLPILCSLVSRAGFPDIQTGYHRNRQGQARAQGQFHGWTLSSGHCHSLH